MGSASSNVLNRDRAGMSRLSHEPSELARNGQTETEQAGESVRIVDAFVRSYHDVFEGARPR